MEHNDTKNVVFTNISKISVISISSFICTFDCANYFMSSFFVICGFLFCKEHWNFPMSSIELPDANATLSIAGVISNAFIAIRKKLFQIKLKVPKEAKKHFF